MTDFSAHPFAAFGQSISFSSTLGLVVIVGAVLVTIASYQRCITWFGDATPGYVACFGWILGISVSNFILVFAFSALMGPAGGRVLLVFACFLAVYWTSCAAKCGLMQSIFIVFAHSILSGLGTVLIFWAAVVFQYMVVTTEQPITSSATATPVTLQPRDPSTAANPVGLRPAQADSEHDSRSQHRAVPGTKANPFFQ
ncbi:hypothetical protein NZK35_16405 [Stieleria sp. ICT_E10.1]|uniref:hypothetical protein n=1 Tax=Stieleria sedimenti TaxID=2976331 RepID=UPI00217F44FA|nr:hypothetical protein [Stieleria sedimenti]MCS7468235.1 hypothetical protein [Stieleria sedimenti]